MSKQIGSVKENMLLQPSTNKHIHTHTYKHHHHNNNNIYQYIIFGSVIKHPVISLHTVTKIGLIPTVDEMTTKFIYSRY